MKSENTQNSQSKKEGGKKEWGIIVFVAVLLVGSILLIIFDKPPDKTPDKPPKVEITYTYIALALIGVVFHLMGQYRKLREQDEFDWKQYSFDYYFRAFQACVYVVVIENLVNPGEETTNPQMVMISLFVGMYIRKVESAFESMGARFGDMLKGILGAAVQKLSPAERRKKQEELQTQFISLKENYEPLKAKLDTLECEKLESEFTRIKTLLQKGNIDAAETKLLNLDFQIKDFQIKHKK